MKIQSIAYQLITAPFRMIQPWTSRAKFLTDILMPENPFGEHAKSCRTFSGNRKEMIDILDPTDPNCRS